MKWFVEWEGGRVRVVETYDSAYLDSITGRDGTLSACGEGRNTGRAWNEATD